MEPPQPPDETKSDRQETLPPQAVPLPLKGTANCPHQNQVKQTHQRLSNVGLGAGKEHRHRSADSVG